MHKLYKIHVCNFQVIDDFVKSVQETDITIISQEIFEHDPSTRVENLKVINEPGHDKTSSIACAPSKDADKPVHLPSLIRVFTVHLKKLSVLSPSYSAVRRLISLGR